MKATIKEGCLTHWFSYTFLYSHVPFPSISIHFLNFVEDCLGYAANAQNLHLQPSQSFQVELETHHAKGGDAASKVR